MDVVKISVVIPVYNMEKYLRECLDNVLAQTLKEIEIICVDDGSTDKSREILKEYEKCNRNIIVIFQKQQGAGPARNAAISMANGRYVAFMDADDYYPEKNVLEVLYIYAERERVVICGGSLIQEKGECKIKDDTSKSRFMQTGLVEYKEYQYALGYQRFIYQTRFLRENGIYFPTYRRFQDPPFMARAMICAGSFLAVNLDVYVYRKFDRAQLFEKFDILNDQVKGMRDVLAISAAANLEKLHGDITRTFLGRFPIFYKSIYKGNVELLDLLNLFLDDMDEGLLRKDGSYKGKTVLKTINEIRTYLDCIYERERKLWEKIRKFSALVIYGAGVTGKCLYEYLMEKEYEGTVEFGVTFSKCNEVVCGKKVYNVEKFLPKQQTVLVLVAAAKKNVHEMMDYAKECGFENVEGIYLEDIRLFQKWRLD